MAEEYDVIVIGTGVSGGAAASRCRDGGMSVAVIDSGGYGGTCPQRGCIPKKVLVGGADMIDWPMRMIDKGSPVSGDFKLQWSELIKFKRTFTDPVAEKTENWLKSLGIATYHGRARFLDSHTLEFNDTKIRGKYIVIATGAKPAELGIKGGEHLVTSDGFMELDILPDDITFIGGGFISFEFAHVAARTGAEVRILNRSSRVLKGFDPEMVDLVVKATEDAGIDVITEKEPVSIEWLGDSYQVTTKDGDSFITGMVVHGAGRVPQTADLDVEKAGIETQKGRIVVNEYMQSVSSKHIYSVGDVTGDFKQLTPTAAYQAAVAATNIIEGNVEPIDYTGISGVVFTVPPLASVGIDSTQVQEGRHRVIFNDKKDWISSRRTNYGYSASKIIIDEKTGLIAGAHLLGPEAEEVINIFSMAMRLKIPAEKLKTFPYSYPTASTDIRSML